MIIVTGTKRSGTSMWMQILRAAGYEVLGEAFPRDWGKTIRAANRRGFFETSLRHGIHRASNKHPATGARLAPESTRQLVVKVFSGGVIRTDLVYIDRVIASMRHWREYAASLERLYAMEQTNKLARARRRGHSREVLPSLAHLPPLLEWWNDNFRLIHDARARRYPIQFVSYAAVLRDRQRVSETLAWLGAGDAVAGLRAVSDELRTQRWAHDDQKPSGLSRAQEEMLDELYERVDQGLPLDERFFERMNRTHRELAPQIAQADKRAREERRRARLTARAALGT